jgi:hypothetical protein
MLRVIRKTHCLHRVSHRFGLGELSLAKSFSPSRFYVDLRGILKKGVRQL